MYTHFCEVGGFTVSSFKQTCVGCTRLAQQCENICEACFRSVCVHCADDHRTQAGVHHPDTLQLPGTAETMKFIVATKIKHKEWTKQTFTPTLHAGIPGTYTELRKIRVVGLNSKSSLKETVEMDCATEPHLALKGILLSRPEWTKRATWTQMPVGVPLPEFHYSVGNPEVRIVGNLLLPEDYIIDRKEWRRNLWRKCLTYSASLPPRAEQRVQPRTPPAQHELSTDVVACMKEMLAAIGSPASVPTTTLETLFLAGFTNVLSYTEEDIKEELLMLEK